jgi:hypothetical protein
MYVAFVIEIIRMKTQVLFLSILCLSLTAFAQQDSTQEEQIDFSQFADMGAPEGSKRYCTSKVLGLSPNKLITVAYDFQGPHQFTTKENFPTPNGIFAPVQSTNPNGDLNIRSSGGLRLAANVPVLSNTKWLINVGGTYWRNGYNVESASANNYVVNNLQQSGLTTIGLNTTIFKPLNEKHFLLVFASADANGTYELGNSI